MIKKEHKFPTRIIKSEGNVSGADALLIPSLGQIHIGIPTKEKVTASGKGYIVLAVIAVIQSHKFIALIVFQIALHIITDAGI